MNPLLEHILGHALPIGLRAGGMFTFAPFFSSEAIPARVKAGFTIVLTAMLYGVVAVPEIPLGVDSWVRMVLSEAAIGLMMGLSVQLVMEGVQLAGQLAGTQL